MANRSRIEYCDYTFNPVTGCRHGCSYCYARPMTRRFSGDIRMNMADKSRFQAVPAADGSEDLYLLDRPIINDSGNASVYPFGFEPTFHRYRLDALDRWKRGSIVFVGAMADLFGTWVPDEWIMDVFRACIRRPQHNYLFLTKNPDRYMKLARKSMLPVRGNFWYGATVTDEDSLTRAGIIPSDYGHVFLSIEPLLEQIDVPEEYWKHLEWIVIGAQTGRTKDKIVPEPEWIKRIVLHADECGVPVFMKDSLIPVIGEENMRRDFPEGLQEHRLSRKMQNKLYSECGMCSEYERKNRMIALMARTGRGKQPKQFGFLCRRCFEKLCNEMNVPMPILQGLEEEINETEMQDDAKGKRDT